MIENNRQDNHQNADFSSQLAKILANRNPSQKSAATFSISEENQESPKKKSKEEEEVKEKEEILKDLKRENEEIIEETEKTIDPNQEILNKIIEVEHEEPEENIDDYISKLEQA